VQSTNYPTGTWISSASSIEINGNKLCAYLKNTKHDTIWACIIFTPDMVLANDNGAFKIIGHVSQAGYENNHYTCNCNCNCIV